MSKKIIGGLIAVLVVVVLGSRVAFANTADVTLTVTPVTNVQIRVDGATAITVPLGNVDLGVSTRTLTAVVLSNTGDVGVSLQKGVQSESANWFVGQPTTTLDGYDVWVATSATAPTEAAFDASDDEITAVSLPGSNLTGVGNSVQTELAVGANVNTWYMIRMPGEVTDSSQKSTVIRFTATALP